MMLSPHFSLAEFQVTNTGLPNVAGPVARSRLRALCREVLEPLREDLGQPVHVTSGYRSREVNEEVNGSKTSQHMQGEAADIAVDGVPALNIAAAIVRLGLPFDQVIWYDIERGGHVHVSFTARWPNRRQVLHAPAAGGYTEGL